MWHHPTAKCCVAVVALTTIPQVSTIMWVTDMADWRICFPSGIGPNAHSQDAESDSWLAESLRRTRVWALRKRECCPGYLWTDHLITCDPETLFDEYSLQFFLQRIDVEHRPQTVCSTV